MDNKDFLMLVIAALFLVMASGGMNIMSGSGSVTAAPSEVIEVPWNFEYTDGAFYGSPASARLVLDEYQFGGVDEVVWTGEIKEGIEYSSVYNYQVPAVEGTYVIKTNAEVWYSGQWRDYGIYTHTITVVIPVYDEPETPVVPPVVDTPADDDKDSGVVPDDTPIDQTVDAAILGDSLWDKVAVLWELIKVFFEQLLGGK